MARLRMKYEVFQFHSGSIKSPAKTEKATITASVSIP